ncbi:MAG: hypothetical protein HS126_37720 [Anaerolineales bacterium]|nr:hypothetical protein [Anaerolineales bacterium]
MSETSRPPWPQTVLRRPFAEGVSVQLDRGSGRRERPEAIHQFHLVFQPGVEPGRPLVQEVLRSEDHGLAARLEGADRDLQEDMLAADTVALIGFAGPVPSAPPDPDWGIA